MKRLSCWASTFSAAMLSVGCAHIDFGAEGLPYFEPVPYLFVSAAADCTLTAALIMLPGQERRLKFITGYGSADLSVTLASGMISDVGQNVDTKVPDTVSALAALKAATAAIKAPPGAPGPDAKLYRVRNGEPDLSKDFLSIKP